MIITEFNIICLMAGLILLLGMEINGTEGQFKTNPVALPDEKKLFVIVGGNNSGKSTFLREVVKTFGGIAYRVDVNRTVLTGEGSQDRNYQTQFKNFVRDFASKTDDNVQKNTQPLQDFFRLKNKEREPILEWYNSYFPNRIYEEREDPENDASPMYLKVNGYSITKQGSGMRATFEIFIKLFDPAIKVLCIDEPEIGLEPYLQKFLFQAIKDRASADKKIFIATHSHHFLDTDEISSNYICERDADNKIFLTEATDLKPIIFRLLGNTLSSFLLPERILVLEGPSDTTYLLEVLKRLGKTSYSIHNSKGIGSMSYAIHAITQFFTFNDEQLSVYKDKLHVIVDKPTKDILVREWRLKVDNPDTQICVLSENGIEYYYPERILKLIFKTNDTRKQIVDGYLRAKSTYNGIIQSKTELSKMVSKLLMEEDLQEQGNQLLDYIRSIPG